LQVGALPYPAYIPDMSSSDFDLSKTELVAAYPSISVFKTTECSRAPVYDTA
jgi:hypothetical protein